jgi:hypothetical protein
MMGGVNGTRENIVLKRPDGSPNNPDSIANCDSDIRRRTTCPINSGGQYAE